MSSNGGNTRKRNRWGERPSVAAGADAQLSQARSTGYVSQPLPPYPDTSSAIFLRGPPSFQLQQDPMFSQRGNNGVIRTPPPPPPPPQHMHQQSLASRWMAPPLPPPPPRAIPPPPPPRNNAVTDSSNINISSNGGCIIAQLKPKLEQTKQDALFNATTSVPSDRVDGTCNDSDMEESYDDEVESQSDCHISFENPSEIKISHLNEPLLPSPTNTQQESLLPFPDALPAKTKPVLQYATLSLPQTETFVLVDAQKNDKIPPAQPQQGAASDRASRLRLAKEKLRHAQAKLVSALKDNDVKKRKRSLTPPPTNLPPITALSQDLVIRDFSGPAHLVEFLPEVELIQAGNLDVFPADISDDDDQAEEEKEKAPPTTNIQLKGHALRKNLLLLRKKKIELMLKMQQQQQQGRASPTNAVATEEDTFLNKEPVPVRQLPLNKEALKKRQEELQQTVDTAYWKRLFLKQRNLLATSESKLVEHATNLQACRNQIVATKHEIVECERNLTETIVREESLNEMISRATQRVLAARKKRHEAKVEAAEAKKRHREKTSKKESLSSVAGIVDT